MVSDIVATKIIGAVKDIFLALIGASVFIFGLIHNTPITSEAVEYVGVYGAYFGLHVYSSYKASASGVSAVNIASTAINAPKN